MENVKIFVSLVLFGEFQFGNLPTVMYVLAPKFSTILCVA